MEYSLELDNAYTVDKWYKLVEGCEFTDINHL